MNSFYFSKEKTNEVFSKIKKDLISNKNQIKKAFKLDYKEWEYDVDYDRIINEIDLFKGKEYLPIFSKEKIVDGIGKICLICNQNPYLIFNFILSALYTNNKVEVILENKMLASNKVLIESIKKSVNELKLDKDLITYTEVLNKTDIIFNQDKYDLIYYFGIKEDFLNFRKRIHIDILYENFGELNLYFDSKEYREEVVEINKWAYLNEIKVNIYNDSLEKSIKQINKLNNINKMTIIFSKDLDKITRFIKEVKSEKIYININPTKNYRFETNLNNLIYNKIIEW